MPALAEALAGPMLPVNSALWEVERAGPPQLAGHLTKEHKFQRPCPKGMRLRVIERIANVLLWRLYAQCIHTAPHKEYS